MDDGLVNNSIRGIQGDHLGNIFIETSKGVSKYDGSAFNTLKRVVSSSNTWKLTTNDLWFNCNGNPNDVYRYDGTSLFELKLPRQDLIEAFGMGVNGLSFMDMNNSPYSVFGLDKDSEGNLWIGTAVAGAFRFDGSSFLWIGEQELTRLPDGRVPGVRSMLEDKNGHMWLSNFKSKYNIIVNDSVSTYEKLEGMGQSLELLEDQIPYFNSGVSDDDGNLWMTTYGGGVWKYDGENLTNQNIEYNGVDALLISIYKDNQGVLWLGSDNAGVFKQNGSTFDKFDLKNK